MLPTESNVQAKYNLLANCKNEAREVSAIATKVFSLQNIPAAKPMR